MVVLKKGEIPERGTQSGPAETGPPKMVRITLLVKDLVTFGDKQIESLTVNNAELIEYSTSWFTTIPMYTSHNITSHHAMPHDVTA